MGRTSKPLTFVIEASIDGPTFDALREQGHTVVRFTDETKPVFALFGPRCWRMDKRVADNPKLFAAALKAMREIYDGQVQDQEAGATKAVESGGHQTVRRKRTAPKRAGKVSTQQPDQSPHTGRSSGDTGKDTPCVSSPLPLA